MTTHSKSVLRAKELRASMPEPEVILWSEIHENKLGFQFRRQHKIGKYYADFVCIAKRLVIELDGEQHGTDAAVKYDNERTEYIKSRAWNIIRIPNWYILRDLDNVLLCLKAILDGEAKIEDVDIFCEKYDTDRNKDWVPPPAPPPKSC